MAAWNEYINVDEESMLGFERLTPESQAWWTRNISNETVSAPSDSLVVQVSYGHVSQEGDYIHFGQMCIDWIHGMGPRICAVGGI